MKNEKLTFLERLQKIAWSVHLGDGCGVDYTNIVFRLSNSLYDRQIHLTYRTDVDGAKAYTTLTLTENNTFGVVVLEPDKEYENEFTIWKIESFEDFEKCEIACLGEDAYNGDLEGLTLEDILCEVFDLNKKEYDDNNWSLILEEFK